MKITNTDNVSNYIILASLTSYGYELYSHVQNILLNHTMNPDSKVHGVYMGPAWDQQDPGGPHIGPMILAIWEVLH